MDTRASFFLEVEDEDALRRLARLKSQ